MGDPFSVAGTAVGITSLGIQTFQVLYHYYAEFKGHHEDIDSVLQQVEGLRGLLEILQGKEDELKCLDIVPSSLSGFKMAIADCKEALAKLRTMAEKSIAIDTGKGWKTRLVNMQKRVTWPFKKETLKELQGNLTVFKDNISIALQCVGLDVLAQELDNICSKLDAVHNNTIDIKREQSLHTVAFGEFRQEYTLNSISQEQQIANVERDLSKLTLMMSRQQAVATHMMEFMQSDKSSQISAMVPSYLAATTQQLERMQPEYHDKYQRYNAISSQQRNSNDLSKLSGICNCRRKTRRSTKRVFGILTSSEEVYAHRPHCPLFSHGEFSKSVAAQFTVYNRIVGACIQVGWQYAKIRGWNTVAPHLRYRAVVLADHSPAFGIIENACNSVHNDYKAGDQEGLGQLLETTVVTLLQCFGEKSSPTDVTQYGTGLFDMLLLFVLNLIGRGYFDTGAILRSLDFCLEHGIPDDETGKTELNLLGISYGLMISENICSEIALHLGRRRDYWCLSILPDWSFYFGFSFYGLLSNALRAGDLLDTLDIDDDVLRAILLRSETDLNSILKGKDIESLVLSLSTPQIISTLASWYRGLEIVFSYVSGNDVRAFVEALWQMAIWRSDPNCLLIITQHLNPVNFDHWQRLNYILGKYGYSLDGVKRKKWKQVFHDVGTRLSAYEETEYGLPLDTKTCDGYSTNACRPLLYHTSDLCVEGADCAWSLGHRGLEEIWHYEHYSSLSGTALWIASIQGSLETAVWLLNHGADPTWNHPTLLTMPAHIVTRRAFSGSAWFKKHIEDGGQSYYGFPEVELRRILFEDGLLTQDLQDRCICHCSVAGCRPVSRAIFALARRNSLKGEKVTQWRYHFNISDVFSSIDHAIDNNWIVPSIVRAMTFEGLLLTHTCCHWVLDKFQGRLSRPSPEETEVVLENKRSEIDQLEDLVAEFEASWDGYEGSFEKYIWHIWRPRMQAVRRGGQDRYEHMADLVRVGVILNDSGKNDDTDDDMTWLEYFLSSNEEEEEQADGEIKEQGR